MSKLAAELRVVLPVSFYESTAAGAHFNSVACLDADGACLGLYRKSHIPDGPGYCEKFYFAPGDTGFKVFRTRYANVGVAVCWDQWFPEAARAMALQGADVLLYPTAIGTEPHDPTVDSRAQWQRAMQGHAACNCVPVVASNRVGTERDVTFYGSSFVTDAAGEIVAQAGRGDEAVVHADVDVAANRKQRAVWGLFRDRRPALYAPLTTMDGGAR